MTYIFAGIVILVLAFSIYKIITRKELPNNNYTVYDDITQGRKHNISPIQEIKFDSKHNPNYEENPRKK